MSRVKIKGRREEKTMALPGRIRRIMAPLFTGLAVVIALDGEGAKRALHLPGGVVIH